MSEEKIKMKEGAIEALVSKEMIILELQNKLAEMEQTIIFNNDNNAFGNELENSVSFVKRENPENSFNYLIEENEQLKSQINELNEELNNKAFEHEEQLNEVDKKCNMKIFERFFIFLQIIKILYFYI